MSPAAAHAIESDKLVDVMQQLERMGGAILPQEIDADAEHQRARDKIGELADAIARSAEDIPPVLDDVELPTAYREEFVQLASDLGKRARELQAAAPASSIAELTAQAATLRRTCEACHTRFRVLPSVR